MTGRVHAASLATILLGAIAITWAQGLPVGAAAVVAGLSVVVFEVLVWLRRQVPW